MSQPMVSAVERCRVGDVTFECAWRLLNAMGARVSLSIDPPYLGDRARQRDAAHARCTTHVGRRLEGAGWVVAREVEVGGDRSRGWIDILAYHPLTGLMLVIEVKTELHDLGQIERTMAWYEREAWVSGRRLGWRPRRVVGTLLLLATHVNDERLRSNRGAVDAGFPLRAAELRHLVDGEEPSPIGRGLAMIDPSSRRQVWLRPSRLDGRRSPAPYADYAGFMRAAQRRQRSGRYRGNE